MNTDSVNNPARYLESRQKRIDNITRIAVGLLACDPITSSRVNNASTAKDIAKRATEIYDAIVEQEDL